MSALLSYSNKIGSTQEAHIVSSQAKNPQECIVGQTDSLFVSLVDWRSNRL